MWFCVCILAGSHFYARLFVCTCFYISVYVTCDSVIVCLSVSGCFLVCVCVCVCMCVCVWPRLDLEVVYQAYACFCFEKCNETSKTSLRSIVQQQLKTWRMLK